MKRAYYSAPADLFFKNSPEAILGTLTDNHTFPVNDLQKSAWRSQISILKEVLQDLSAPFHIAFEYSIPRMGKRADTVIIYKGLVFVLEFKVGADTYPRAAIDQVMDYALDLKNFHEQSHDRDIIPILVSTKAQPSALPIQIHTDRIWTPLFANAQNLGTILKQSAEEHPGKPLDPKTWINSVYKPTPTIIEAAQALYQGHSVKEISRSDSGAINLSKTSAAISDIIDHSKIAGRKSICFITGVPGAGKTLAGLNIATERHNEDKDEHAVFLSGNGPLVGVLQEALARDEICHSNNNGEETSKKDALRKAKSFIQNIHHFRDDNLQTCHAPIEKVVVFDEAQRAWTTEHTSSFMAKKRGMEGFHMSEPEFLISVMDRHKDWTTIICLIGGGQEINTGEAGLPEWFQAIQMKYQHWDVYVSDKLTDDEYTYRQPVYEYLEKSKLSINRDLHLAVSVRSFRSEKLAEFVKALLDLRQSHAAELYEELKSNYPIALTRELGQAKEWLKRQARGRERFGITAYSGARRLKPEGIHVKSKIDPRLWFLNGPDDVRSSLFLEDAATEFDIQGLELDWTCVAWDPSLRIANGEWEFKKFCGTKWQNVNIPLNQRYLLNAYRVLLTRARQGMIIYVPNGDQGDPTRTPEWYDSVANYFEGILR